MVLSLLTFGLKLFDRIDFCCRTRLTYFVNRNNLFFIWYLTSRATQKVGLVVLVGTRLVNYYKINGEHVNFRSLVTNS